MQFCRADRPAEIVDFVLAFRPHSDLLAKISTVSARPVYSTAGLLTWRVNRPASKPVRTKPLKTSISSPPSSLPCYCDLLPLHEADCSRRPRVESINSYNSSELKDDFYLCEVACALAKGKLDQRQTRWLKNGLNALCWIFWVYYSDFHLSISAFNPDL